MDPDPAGRALAPGWLVALVDALPQPAAVFDAAGRRVVANARGGRLAPSPEQLAACFSGAAAPGPGRLVALPGELVLALTEVPSDGLLADIAHDLRTPLNNALGYISLVADGLANDLADVRRYAQAAQAAALELNDRLAVVLDLGRIRHGRLELRMERVAMAVAVAETADRLAGRAAARQLAIVAPEPAAEPVVLVDPVRLRQMLEILLLAAMERAGAGAVQLALDAAAGYARLVVTAPRVDAPERNGPALALAGELAAAMGGKITRRHDAPGADELTELILPVA